MKFHYFPPGKIFLATPGINAIGHPGKNPSDTHDWF